MHDGNGAGLIEMRMGVLIGRWTVSSPAGMPDADLAENAVFLQEIGETLVDLAFLFVDAQFAAVENGQAGAVVTAVFKAAQPLENDRGGDSFADVSNNSAHLINRSQSCVSALASGVCV